MRIVIASEAIQSTFKKELIAVSLTLLAMTSDVAICAIRYSMF
jgi:hypothetical protein